jgi:hypothetical protein
MDDASLTPMGNTKSPHHKATIGGWSLGRLALIAAFVLPPIILTAALASLGSGASQTAETIAMALALGVGAGFVLLIRLPWFLRVLAVVVYLPLMAYLLFLLGVSYVCTQYSRCL